ncbi:ficolin-2-like isoform X1 [Diabrotica virgifera virgifera]|uniref:Fibrinogen C-terminal domain-containing protein n=1 Tax=Diabrotica virgifera virgifera TaxID=50390 RepID=A0ABM5IZC0_DIAVI|nr:ficolin-2-like isoform X1 [Diabrotica virgifera virgifera]
MFLWYRIILVLVITYNFTNSAYLPKSVSLRKFHFLQDDQNANDYELIQNRGNNEHIATNDDPYFSLRNQIFNHKSKSKRSTQDKARVRVRSQQQTIDQLSDVIQTLSNNVQSIVNRHNEICTDLVGVSRPLECLPEDLRESSPNHESIARDCKDIQLRGENVSGIYEIRPENSSKSFKVLCDMEIREGGWIHIQKRFDGSEDFYRDWKDYKFGFGNLKGEFWIGLEQIYALTKHYPTELLIELTDRNNTKRYAHYLSFAIGPEIGGYNLTTIGGFTGDIPDAMKNHRFEKFSTRDFDQDQSNKSCAETFMGAWWYKKCFDSNLNGKFVNIKQPRIMRGKGISWLNVSYHDYYLSGSRMLLRPLHFFDLRL